jgi:PAS domain S-box-containing protein
MGKALRLLLIEDSEDDAELLRIQLTRGGYDLEMTRVDTRQGMNEALENKDWDIIISDYALPQFSGLSALEIFSQKNLDIPFIILSGTIGEETAVEMMRAGASDYMIKGNVARLIPAIEREVRETSVRRERSKADNALRASEEKFAKAFHTSPDAVVISRLSDGVILDTNVGFTNMMGYTAQEAQGKTTLGLGLWLNENNRKFFMDSIRNSGEVTNLEMPFYRKDGSIHTGLISAKTIEIDGEMGLLTITRDITERKQNEERIQRQVQQLAALHSIDNAITSGFDLYTVLNTLLEQVTEQLVVDAATVLMLDQKSQTLEYAASRGFKTAALRHTRLRLGEGLAGQAALQQRMFTVENLKESESSLSRSLSLDEEGFIAYFSIPLIARRKVLGVLEVFHRKPIEPNSDWLNFLEAMVGQAAIALDNSTMFNELQIANAQLMFAIDDTIQAWARALELRDIETANHSKQVVEKSMQLARKMGLNSEELRQVQQGAMLHDVGKMGIPDSILLKPDKLEPEEWKIMKLHPVYAYNLLNGVPYLRAAADIPYCHHEHWDGSGYPRGLKGVEIPLTARIFAVADVWEALLQDRPYRKAWSVEKVIKYIRDMSGKQFDPHIVDLFMEMIKGE